MKIILLSYGDIIGRVDHLPHQPCQAIGGQDGQPKPPAGNSVGEHENIVNTRGGWGLMPK